VAPTPSRHGAGHWTPGAVFTRLALASWWTPGWAWWPPLTFGTCALLCEARTVGWSSTSAGPKISNDTHPVTGTVLHAATTHWPATQADGPACARAMGTRPSRVAILSAVGLPALYPTIWDTGIGRIRVIAVHCSTRSVRVG